MEEELDFTITPKQIQNTTSHLDFAVDICLLNNEMEQAQLLRQVETECEKVGLESNDKKTEVMAIIIPAHVPLTTVKGKELAEVCNFKYTLTHTCSQQKLT